MKKTFVRVLCVALCLALVMPCLALAQSAEDFVLRGDEYLASGDAERARTAYELAVKMSPEDDMLLVRVAEKLRVMGDADSAMDYLSRALTVNPACGDAYRSRALLSAAKGDMQGAYRDMLSAEVCWASFTPEDYAALGLAFANAGMDDVALASFEAAGDTATGASYAQTYRALLNRNGQRDKAVALLGGVPRDAELDAAFASGKLSLKEKPLFSEDATYTVRANKAYLEGELVGAPEGTVKDDGTYLYIPIGGGDLSPAIPLSVSPDGKTKLLLMEQFFITLRDDTVTMLTPNFERGVADEYGKLARMTESPSLLRSYFGSEGAVWSPDGRYFVLTHWRDSLMNGRYVHDLVVFDTEIGEYFLATTYPIKILDGGGTVVQAQFDATGHTIYYLYWGAGFAERIALLSYNLASGENKLLYNSSEFIAQPRLERTPDGRYVNLSDSARSDDYCGFNVYSFSDGAWRNDIVRYPVPMRALRSQYLSLSSETGLGVVLHGTRSEKPQYLISRVDFSSGAPVGQDELLLIDSLDATSAIPARMTNFFDAEGAPVNPGAPIPSVNVVSAQMSPDGWYALLLLMNGEQYAYRLMDMNTLTLAKVDAPEEVCAATAGFNNPMSAFAPGFQWFAGHTLIIGAREGEGSAVRSYTLSYE